MTRVAALVLGLLFFGESLTAAEPAWLTKLARVDAARLARRLDAPGGGPRPSREGDLLIAARERWESRDYDAVVAVLGPHVKESREDDPALGLLVLALLAERDREEAQAYLDVLERRAGGSAPAGRVLERIRGVMARLHEQHEFEARLLQAVGAGCLSRAEELVSDLDAPPDRKARLAAQLRLLAGDFARARSAVASMPASALTDPDERVRLRMRIDDAEGRLNEAASTVDWYLYSPETLLSEFPRSGDGVRAFAELDRFSVGELVLAVSEVARLAPLGPRSGDLVFLAGLLASPYEEMERVGLRVLEGRGVLRVPFHSGTARLNLVIDARHRRLSLVEDAAHPLLVRSRERYAGVCWTFTRDCWEKVRAGTQIVPIGWARAPVSFRCRPHAAFDFAFEEISRIEQLADGRSGAGELARNDYALMVRTSERTGVAPRWPAMGLIHSRYGRDAQRAITNKLGRFLVRVLGSRNVTAKLAAPDSPTGGDWYGMILGAGAQGSPGARRVEVATVFEALVGSTRLVTGPVDARDLESRRSIEDWQRSTLELTAGLALDRSAGDVRALTGRERSRSRASPRRDLPQVVAILRP